MLKMIKNMEITPLPLSLFQKIHNNIKTMLKSTQKQEIISLYLSSAFITSNAHRDTETDHTISFPLLKASVVCYLASEGWTRGWEGQGRRRRRRR